LIALAVLAGRLRPRLAALSLVVIAGCDLLRAGGGLNPMMDGRRLGTAPEVLAALETQEGVQRVYSCRPEASPAYWAARRDNPFRHEALSLAAWADTLTPHFNRPAHVRSALSEDLTSLVPLGRLLPPGGGCGDVTALLPRLRAAGVSHVLSLDPLDHPGLRALARIQPAGLAPLEVFVYSVADPTPLRYLADDASGSVRFRREGSSRVELDVAASRPTDLVVADGWAPGWSASVNGIRTAVRRRGEHRAVAVPAGPSAVVLAYAPPGLRTGLVLFTLSAAVLAALGPVISFRRRRAHRDQERPHVLLE
jgi:hypothetical protein